MIDGKSPLMRVKMKNRKTGQIVSRDIPLELHHRLLAQRNAHIRAILDGRVSLGGDVIVFR